MLTLTRWVPDLRAAKLHLSGMTGEEKLCPYRPAISRAMSIIRAEKPHSLSYQPKMRTW